MRPVLIQTSHKQRRRSSLALSEQTSAVRNTADSSPFTRQASCSGTDHVNILLQENKSDNRRSSIPGHIMPHLLQKRKSHADKRSTASSHLDAQEELRTANLVWIGLLIISIFAAVVIFSVICKYYFNIPGK